MDVMTEHRATGRVDAASALGVQAAIAGVVGLGVIAYGVRHPGSGSGAAGLVLLAVAPAVAVVAAGIGGSRPWATPLALGVEVVLGLASLTRLRSRPAFALVGLALELTVIVLLARRRRTDRPMAPRAAFPMAPQWRP